MVCGNSTVSYQDVINAKLRLAGAIRKTPLIQSETSGDTKEDKGEVWNNYVRNHSSEIPEWWLKQRD